MTDFCFVHAADLRLDRPWQGIGRTSPRVAEALTSAAVRCLGRPRPPGGDRQAACLLLPGGIGYGTPYSTLRQRLAEGLLQLAGHSIPVSACRMRRLKTGLAEHARGGGWRADIPADQRTSRRGCRRFARGHGVRHEAASASAPGVGRHRYHRANQGLRIGLKYLPGEDGTGSYQSVESPESLTEYGVDYWALGGRSAYQCISGVPPWIVYSGALQGRSVETEGDGRKGAVIVECRDGIVEQATFHALDRIRAVRIQVDATGVGDAEALWQALMRQGHSLRLQHEGRSIVVAVSIAKAAENQSWLREADLEAMLERLRRATDRGVDHGNTADQFFVVGFAAV